jgi:hypothetical protein
LRKITSVVLIFLGAFLVVVAGLAKFYAVDAVKKTPLDVSSVSRLDGPGQLFNGKTVDHFRAKVTSTTHADSAKSDGSVVSFLTSTCVLKDIGNAPDCVSAKDPQNRLISVSKDSFAANRTSAMAVNDPQYLPPDATKHEGLVNKFPFGTQKRTYPYWDGTVGHTVDATYDGEATLQGLTTYKFAVAVHNAAADIAPGVPGRYSVDTEIWVDPVTGAIVNQTEHQVQTMADGSPVLDINVKFTHATISKYVDASKTGIFQLKLLGVVVPLVGLVLGLVLLAIGLTLALSSRRRTPGHL